MAFQHEPSRSLRVEWYFRDISDDPSEKELTQQDQFNNDEVALAEALVRETIQNSTDASANGGRVRVRFALHTIPTPAGTSIIRRMVDGLIPDLKASELALPAQPGSTRLLVIEDFGTTGLKGAIDIKDDGQFCGFWRRFGRSNKKAAQGGRWGLGKLVFPSASQVRTVVGLTRRSGDPSTGSWVRPSSATIKWEALKRIQSGFGVTLRQVARACRPKIQHCAKQ
jgi:hypothetical protein